MKAIIMTGFVFSMMLVLSFLSGCHAPQSDPSQAQSRPDHLPGAGRDDPHTPAPAPPPQSWPDDLPGAMPGTEFVEPAGASLSTVPEFPWPPPQASGWFALPEYLLKQPAEVATLGDVNKKLRKALFENGYAEISYLAVPGGFALVTRLERINPDGTPKEPGRWSQIREPIRKFSLAEYLRALFLADPGLYRINVFLVTNHAFSQSPETVSHPEAEAWLREGLNRLPDLIDRQEYTNKHFTTVLIYEFEKTDSRTSLRYPSQVTGRTHLEKSGVLTSIEKF